jgi:NAD(P)-dependent dehydrogenase (short-subunit alcohol dehydrogenase family)
MNAAAPISLVTDANRGIGRATVRQLAGPGHTVLLCARWPEDTESAAESLAGLPQRLDVTAPELVRALAHSVEAEFGRPHVLVNLAAINCDTHAHAVDLDEICHTLETILFGAWPRSSVPCCAVRRTPGSSTSPANPAH